MTLKANALTSVAFVKQIYPTISSNFTDPDIEYLIGVASDFVELYCGRKFDKQTKIEKLTGNCKERLRLKQFPVISITEVLVDEEDITTDVVEDTVEDDLSNGFIYYEEGFFSAKRGIKATYEHGYITRAADDTNFTLPLDLENIVIRIIINIADDILSKNANINNGGTNNPNKLKAFSVTDVSWQFGESRSTAQSQRGLTVNIMAYLSQGEQSILDMYREMKV